ncbi:zinc finger protein DHHC domain containing protein [Babesia caballi]|uniref:Palmitoyltransferase n=1 Tax=Babesia caballi TaxID=5871 RepID=A0AAV4M3F2_BABCB|nr:zinc finger protein DHHC domain containing protein [Babesia caballi]
MGGPRRRATDCNELEKVVPGVLLGLHALCDVCELLRGRLVADRAVGVGAPVKRGPAHRKTHLTATPRADIASTASLFVSDPGLDPPKRSAASRACAHRELKTAAQPALASMIQFSCVCAKCVDSGSRGRGDGQPICPRIVQPERVDATVSIVMPPKGRLFGGKSKAGKIFMFLLVCLPPAPPIRSDLRASLPGPVHDDLPRTDAMVSPERRPVTTFQDDVPRADGSLDHRAHAAAPSRNVGALDVRKHGPRLRPRAARSSSTPCAGASPTAPNASPLGRAAPTTAAPAGDACCTWTTTVSRGRLGDDAAAGPWVVNCVGMFNQKFFIQYTAYIFLAGAMEIALACVVGYDMYDLYCTNVSRLLSKYGAALMVATTVMFFLSVPFSMFAVTLFIDQLCNVNRNTTAIDQLKGIPARRQPFIQSLSRVLGGRPGLTWLLPLPMKPRYLNDELTSSDIVALSIFDDAEAALSDRNHELLGLDAAEEQGCARRRCAFKAATCRWKTDAVNDDS